MKKLTPRHVKAAQLEASGMLAKNIAKECQVTPQTISAYRQLDEYQVLVSKVASASHRAAQLKLIEGSYMAAEAILDVMESANSTVRLKAAETVLKMVGMADAVQEIGPTSLAEKKAGETYQSLDLKYLQSINKKADEFLTGLGV